MDTKCFLGYVCVVVVATETKWSVTKSVTNGINKK